MKNLIFKCVAGSHSYGLATEKSDTDYHGIYIAPLRDVYIGKVENELLLDNNNEQYFEIGRFLHFLGKANPKAIEMLFNDNVVINNHIESFQNLRKYRRMFLSKELVRIYLKFGEQQVKKSIGENKKYKQEITEPKIMDYCWVETNDKRGSYPLEQFLSDNNFDIKRIGLTAVDHFEFYYIHYDYDNKGLYKGVFGKDNNCVIYSSIEKDIMPIGRLSFAKDGYSSHLKKYNEYLSWDKNKNMDRYTTNMIHGKNYDSKNMMHNLRILLLAESILDNHDLNLVVDAKTRSYLLDVKAGKYELKECLHYSDRLIESINRKLETNFLYLPETADLNNAYLDNVLYNIREFYYND